MRLADAHKTSQLIRIRQRKLRMHNKQVLVDYLSGYFYVNKNWWATFIARGPSQQTNAAYPPFKQ
jgi:hypothetical protein